MKKILSFVLCMAFVFSAVTLISCNTKQPDQTAEINTDVTKATETETQISTETQVPSETSVSAESTTENGEQPAVEPWEKDSIKILAIGNSFSVDSMEYLYNILKDMGLKDVYLGNLYIGGCSLETHAENATGNFASYTYYTNSSGTWTSVTGKTIEYAIQPQSWDFISLQQVSGLSGVADSYEPSLSVLLEAVEAIRDLYCPNAKLIWNMTWAYQQNSTHTDFSKYGKDQLTMYNAIVSAVQSAIEVHSEFDVIVPTGTAIQNLRTSFIGDNITRDGYHLNMTYGRYCAALTWAKAITGRSIDDVSFMPATSFPQTYLDVIKDAVNSAINNPYEITESSITAAKTIDGVIQSLGIDMNDYTVLNLDFTKNATYNSASKADYNRLISYEAGDNSNILSRMAATRIFAKSELPNGTLIIVATGYKYIPEGWTDMQKNDSRPKYESSSVVIVDDEWWGDYNFRAFVSALESSTKALSDSEMETLTQSLRILVPKNSSVVPPVIGGDDEPETDAEGLDAILKEAGYDLSNYEKLDLNLTTCAFYNSNDSKRWSRMICSANGDSDSNLSQFATTQIFEKNQIPTGSILVLKPGYQYRPDAWISIETRNTNRPGNVKTSIVVVDEAWWGQFNYRAFNLAFDGNPGLSDEQMATLAEAFAIYVPIGGSDTDKPEEKEESKVADEIFVASGYNLSEYTKLDLQLTNAAYYNSTSSSTLVSSLNSTASNLSQFVATRIFNADELPVGTVIVIGNGYQYRPEGWVSLTTKNASSSRPSTVTTTLVVVDNNWVGSYAYRAFNISMTGNPSMTEEQMEILADAFAIFVPKD